MNVVLKASLCRVLVVDDKPGILHKLKKLLTGYGFTVMTASSQAEALRLFAAYRFHVAVLDVHLSDDDQNREGLDLMHKLREYDPSMGIIMLSAMADASITREALRPQQTNNTTMFQVSRAPADEFLEKSEDLPRDLPLAIRSVFKRVVRVSSPLRLVDDGDQLKYIIKRLRFKSFEVTDRHDLYEEISELFRKAFIEWEGINVYPIITQTSGMSGYSRAVVFKIVPFNNGDQGAQLVAKIGEYDLIEQEINNHRAYIRGRSQRCPATIDPGHRTRHLGAIVYTFVGLDDKIIDFADFFNRVDDPAQLEQVVSNLFLDTLKIQHGRSRVHIQQSADMLYLYKTILRLQEAELREKEADLIRSKGGAYRLSSRSTFYLFNQQFVAPVEYALTAGLTTDYLETIIHGDLHAHNVLLDHHDETWLIDFANTCRGPLLQDYVTFEAAIVVELVDCDDTALLLRWAQALYNGSSLSLPVLDEQLEQHAGIQKATMVIRVLRKLAFRDRGQSQIKPLGFEKLPPETNERTYLIGVLFTLLRLMTVRFLPETRRAHALLAAALVAKRLKEQVSVYSSLGVNL